jgi:hypothetical protein
VTKQFCDLCGVETVDGIEDVCIETVIGGDSAFISVHITSVMDLCENCVLMVTRDETIRAMRDKMIAEKNETEER